MAYLDDLLGPTYPKRDTVKPTPRTDGGFEGSTAGPGEANAGDDMGGPSQYTGETNSKLKETLGPVTYDENGKPNRGA